MPRCSRASTQFSANAPTLKLDAESLRVLERYHLDFVRAGAQLGDTGRTRLAEIGARQAVLATQFSQHVLGDEEDYVLPLEEHQLSGLPQSLRDAATATAKERDLAAPYGVTLSRSSAEPFLQYADDRALREQLFKAWVARGAGDNANNNIAIMDEMLALRAERAKLLGYDNFAAFKLADSMAGAPQAARALLERVWAPARKSALAERDALQDLIAREGGNFKLAPWDWRYYAEKLRKERFDFDEAALKPYFQLDNLIAAVFFTAEKLFGLTFRERHDMPVYHPDVRVWEVVRGGTVTGLFYGDYFARMGKQGGAWMSSLRDQQRLSGNVLPIILNNLNFTKADPCLLGFDDAETLFHEFGHALHGLLSKVTYPRLSGTNVARDFVELPSQIYEHWLEEPQVLQRFARHYQTGEPMPAALLDKMVRARNFGQGFGTVELLASAIIDMDFHTSPPGDALATQRETLARIGMPEEFRRATPRRISGTSSAATVMPLDITPICGPKCWTRTALMPSRKRATRLTPATARRLHDFIYSSGGTLDFAQAYRDFRGRDPRIEPLLEGRGLDAA